MPQPAQAKNRVTTADIYRRYNKYLHALQSYCTIEGTRSQVSHRENGRLMIIHQVSADVPGSPTLRSAAVRLASWHRAGLPGQARRKPYSSARAGPCQARQQPTVPTSTGR